MHLCQRSWVESAFFFSGSSFPYFHMKAPCGLGVINARQDCFEGLPFGTNS